MGEKGVDLQPRLLVYEVRPRCLEAPQTRLPAHAPGPTEPCSVCILLGTDYAGFWYCPTCSQPASRAPLPCLRPASPFYFCHFMLRAMQHPAPCLFDGLALAFFDMPVVSCLLRGAHVSAPWSCVLSCHLVLAAAAVSPPPYASVSPHTCCSCHHPPPLQACLVCAGSGGPNAQLVCRIGKGATAVAAQQCVCLAVCLASPHWRPVKWEPARAGPPATLGCTAAAISAPGRPCLPLLLFPPVPRLPNHCPAPRTLLPPGYLPLPIHLPSLPFLVFILAMMAQPPSSSTCHHHLPCPLHTFVTPP